MIIESKLNNRPTLVWTCHRRRNVFWKCYVKNAWFKKKLQKQRKFWKKCHHFSTATKSLSQLPNLQLLRENFEQISKNCGEHVLNLLWDAHLCPKNKWKKEKTLAIRGRAIHEEPLVWTGVVQFLILKGLFGSSFNFK